MNLLAVALAQHEAGETVIAVNEKKSPYLKGWSAFFKRRQTETEVREQFGNGAHGIAVLLYPASPRVHLDFDGPHAEQAWQRTGIELPETATNHTRSGFKHLIFRPAEEMPKIKRKVRLVVADCDCRGPEGKPKPCGVDLLINGIAVIPPTPGYREDPDRPLESAVEIPPEILKLAEEKPRETRRTGDASGRVADGQRNVTACSLAGTMRARGMSIESIRAALKADNEQRFDPPLTDREIEGVLTQAEKWAVGAERFNCTDMGNAARMAFWQGEDIRYSQQLGWLVWDGKRFRADNAGEIERRARDTVRSVYREAAEEPDKDRREALATWAQRSESEQRIRSMIRLCESENAVATRAEVFDNQPMLLSVANGTIDLRTGALREHRRHDLITKIAPVEFDPSADCPRFIEFLNQIFRGDAELIVYLQKIAGYCLTGSTSEQEFYLCYGLGANGKTTLVKTFLRIAGDYGAQSPAETFLVKKTGSGAIPNDIARLKGARLVVATESEANQRLAESLVKALTGGDRIAARFLHREFFEFEPGFKLILSTNHRPRIVGTDTAIWRRVRLIPFTVSIPPEKQDKSLAEKFECELSGILTWAVEGCLRWQKDGLNPPAAVKAASENYRQDSDTLGDFLEARCKIAEQATVPASNLYKAYAEWSEEQKDRERDRLNRITFGHALAERGFESGRNWQGRFWRGIRLLGQEP